MQVSGHIERHNINLDDLLFKTFPEVFQFCPTATICNAKAMITNVSFLTQYLIKMMKVFFFFKQNWILKLEVL